MAEMQWLTFKKGVFCALRPPLWHLLALRVAPAIEHIPALSRFSFQTVVDVGGNRGQFAAIARRLFPIAQIYSFEPLAGPATSFINALGRDGKIRLFNNAIGPVAGSAPIYVTTRDDSSSLLKPGAAQSEIFGVQTERVDQITVRRLSDCLSNAELQAPALLKVDVQGGELDVLEGSADLIARFDAIYVECSYLQLYEGQPLYADIARWADGHGFRLAGVYNQHVDAQRGPVQADFLFLRAERSTGAGK
jgi:FkbM family methyltransferase